MGTNYYWHKPACHTCGHAERKHIGKSSGGWCFALHVYLEEGIHGWRDWEELLCQFGVIRNEYGDRVTISEMRECVLERSWRGGWPRRNKIDGVHCIAHGDGTWDCLVGDFS